MCVGGRGREKKKICPRESDNSNQVSGISTGSVAQLGESKTKLASLIGDSIVKASDRHICCDKQDFQMVCCSPGARFKDVSEWA